MKNRQKVAKVKSGGILLGYNIEYEDCIECFDTACKYVLWFRVKGALYGYIKAHCFAHQVTPV